MDIDFVMVSREVGDTGLDTSPQKFIIMFSYSLAYLLRELFYLIGLVSLMSWVYKRLNP